MLITIEGVSGAGKTTLVRALTAHLRSHGHPVVDLAALEQASRDPSWHLGELMRTLPTPFPPAEAALLYTARTAGRARLAHHHLATQPTTVVVADRLGLSLAVQLAHADLDTPTRHALLAVATAALPPAVSILLDLTHPEHTHRLRQRGHAPLTAAAFAAARNAFHAEYHRQPEPSLLLDTTRATTTEVLTATARFVTPHLPASAAS
jgi:thymidylate kinase